MSGKYVEGDLGSSLEAPAMAQNESGASSVFGPTNRYSLLSTHRRTVLIVFAVLGVLILTCIAALFFSQSADDKKSANYSVDSIPLSGLSVTPLQLGQADHLAINGRLIVNDGLVLTPGAQPKTAVTGQMYYDQTTNKPYYYDGKVFVSLVQPVVETVSSIGGSRGVIGLGSGLQISGGQLRLTDAILQASTAPGATSGLVSSVQGQTGDVSFTGGAGIAVNGTAFTNTGLLSLGGSAGNLGLGRGLAVQGGALKSTISLAAGSANLIIADDGNGNYTITDTGSSSSQIILGPGVSQPDTTGNTTININKTSAGNFLQLASNGVDRFVVDQSGTITTGAIAYTQVTGAPATTVTGIGGASGAIALGSGLTIAANTLSNTGVVSLTGTANQIFASAASGAVVLSLPQAIATTSNPSFNNLALGGNLSTTGNSSLGGTLSVAGITTLSGGAAVSGTVNINTTGSSATAIGNVNNTLTLQGNAGSVFTATAGGFNTTIGFASPTANVTYQFATAAAGTYNICTTAGNCAGTGNVTSAGGTPGAIAKFSAAQVLSDSLLSESGTTVTVGGSLAVNTIAPTAAFLLGVTSQNVTMQGANVAITSTSGANTNTLSFATPAGGSKTITLPNASGTVVISASGPLAVDANGNLSCATCVTTGGGAGGAVDSLNALNGALTLQGTLNQVIVSTNAGTKTITVSTPQDINTSSSPTFSSATLTNTLSVTNNITAGSLSLGTALTVANGGTGTTTAAGARTNLGAAAAGANSDITSITGLTTALSAGQGGTGVNGGTAANGRLLIGNGTGYTLANLTQGSGISITNGAGSISIAVDNTICTTAGNCAGSGTGVTTAGGTTGTISLFTGAQAIGDSIISQSGTVISVAGTLTATALQGDGAAINNLNASNLASGTVASARLSGAYSGITGVGALSAGSIISGFGSISTSNSISTTAALQGNSLSIGGGTFTVNATGAITTATGITSSGTITLSSLSAGGLVRSNASGVLSNGTVVLGSETTGNYVATLGTLTGLTTTGNTGAGSTPSLAVTYGSGANTAAQGNTAFSFTPSGNLTGSLSGTAGGGFTTTTLAIVNNPTFSGLVSANGGLSVANATSFTNAGATLNVAINIPDLATGGFVGSAAATVDSATTFNINQTTASQTLSLPNPTTVTAGRIVYINNVGSTSFVLNGNTIASGQSAAFEWNGTAWVALNNAVAGTGLSQSGNVINSAAATSVVNDTNITGSISGNVLTLGYTGTLSVARGGTNATTAAGARTNLGAAASGANADIVSLSVATSVGSSSAALTLQGNASSVFAATAGSFTTSIGFASPSANVNYLFQPAAAGTYNICTTAGNCSGSGGGVTTAGGTTGAIAKFTGAQTLGDSLLSEAGSTVTVGGTLAVNTIAPTAAFLLGVTSQNVTVQGASVAITSTSGANTNTLNFANPAGGSKTIILPNASGTVAVSATGPLAIDANGNITCATCTTGGGGAGGAVDSLNAINGAITLQGTANQIIVSNNAGTRTITVSTPQDINTSSSPTFSSATLTNTLSVTNAVTAGSLSTSGTLAVTGAATAASFNGLTLTANATGFTVAGGTAVRTVTVTSNVTLDQDLSTTSAPSFTGLTSTGTLAVTGATTLTGALAANGGLTTTNVSATGNISQTGTGTFSTGTGAVSLNGATAVTGTSTLTVGTGATTLGGTLAVTGAATFAGATTYNGSVTVSGANTLTTGTGAVTLGVLGAGIVQSNVSGLLSAGAVDRNSASILSGTLSVANGGTGNATYSNTGVLYYNGTNFVSTAASTGAQCLITTGSGVAPTWGSCTNGTAAVSSVNSFTGAVNVVGTANQVIVSNASNTVTLSTPQDINTTAAVQFGNVYVTSAVNPGVGTALIYANNTNGAPTGNLADLQTNGSSKFSVSAAGNVTATGSVIAVGVNGGTGLIQGTGGLTIGGTITLSSLNAAGVVHTNGSGVLSTGVVILGSETSGNYVASVGAGTGTTVGGTSGAGAVPVLNVTYGSTANTAAQGNTSLTFTGSGNLTGTLSGTAGGGFTTTSLALVNNPNFSGTLTVQGAGGITAGSATAAGVLKFLDGTADGFTSSIQLAGVLGSNQTYSLPTTGGTFCLSTNNCNYQTAGSYALTSDTTNFIRNQSSQQASSNFNISGTGTAATSLLTPSLDTAVAGALGLGGTTATSVTIAKAGVATTIAGSLTVTQATAFNGSVAVSGTNTLTVGTGATALGGTLAVTGATTLTGALAANGGLTTTNVTATGNVSQTGTGTFSTGTGAVGLNGATAVTGSNNFTVGTGATALGGTLSVAGAGTFSAGLAANGGLSVATTTTFTNAGSTLNSAVAITDKATGGTIGTAAATVDGATTFTVSQTTAGQTLSLPPPTNATAGRIAYVANTGTASFIMHGVTIAPGSAQVIIWNGTAWTAASIDGSGSGAATIGALDGQAKNANGAVISGGSLFLQTADATNPGLVSTGAQTFGGTKSFSGNLAVTGVATLTTGTGAVTLGSLGAGIVQSSSAGLLSSGAVDRNSATLLSGTLSIANGGTGNATYTGNGVVYYDGSKFVSTAASTGAQCLISTGAGVAPTFGSCSTGVAAGVSSVNSFTGAVSVVGTTNQVNVANASNTVTLSLPQAINTTAAVQFGTLTLANAGTTSSLSITATGNPAAGSALLFANNTNAAPSGNLLDLQSLSASKFAVTASGAVTAASTITGVGVNSGSGLLQGSGGLTISGATSITGAVSINTTGTANTTIGNATGNFSVTSSALNITSAGAISGVTTLSASGAISAATTGNTINGLVINSGSLSGITGYAQASGNFSQAGTGSFSTGTGAIALNGATTVNSTLAVTTLGATNSDAVLCRNGANQLAACTSTFATTSSLAGYVQLQGATPGAAQTGNINITGTTIASTINATTALQTAGTTRIDASGNVTGGNGSFTGTLAVTGAATFGTASTTTGQLRLANSASAFLGTLQVASLTQTTTYTIPASTAANDSFCLVTLANCSGAGASTVGALDGGTANANGATITTNTLYLQSASASFAGLVNTTTQTFAGAKTFSGTLAVTGASTFTGAAVLNGGVTVAAGQSISLVGGITSTRPAAPTEGMLYYDTTTKALLVYANGKWQADRSSNTVIVADGSTSSNPESADYVVPAASTSAETTINTAIAALPAAGGTVFLREGTYQIGSTINVPSKVTITGAGNATIVKIKNALNVGVNVFTTALNANNITISHLQIDGNKTNNSAGTQSGIAMTSSVGSGSGSTAVAGINVSGVDIRNLRNDGIDVVSASNSNFTNNKLINNGGSGFYYSGASTNNVIANNLVAGNTVDGLSTLNFSNSSITGNTFQSNGGKGAYLWAMTTSTFTGNNSVSNASDGILLYQSSGNTVSGNVSSGNTGYGISFGSADRNNVSGNSIATNAGGGIGIGGSSDTNNIIASNKLYDNGGAGANSSILIDAVLGAAGNTITGNDIVDTAGTGFAIKIAATFTASPNTYLSNNIFSGTGATSISDVGIGTIYVNQSDGSGNLINRNQGGFSVGKTTASTTLDVQGAIRTTVLTSPAAPTLSTSGTAGSTSYSYAVTALDGLGETLASTATTIATGNATLTGTNLINISWTQVSGAVQYKIYRTASAGTPASTGLIATVAANVFTTSDTGLAASTAVPGANTTGRVNVAGLLQGTQATLTSSNALYLGASASANGAITFYNSGNANTIRIAAPGNATAAYSLVLPTSAGAVNDCLKNDATTPGALTFGTCGVNTIGTYSTTNTAADGATISGNSLILQNASATAPGLIGTGAQTIAGVKTFNNAVNVNGGAFANISTSADAYGFNATLTNTNTSATANGVNGLFVSLTGTNNTNALSNFNTGVNLNSVTPATNNTFIGINVGTGFGDILRYNGTQLISGTGILQSAAVNGTYGNLTGVGALASGSIASGFGTISTGNTITTSTTLQGATVNATTGFTLGGANINTAGTLTNVAYLNQANTFSAANAFSSTLAVTGAATFGAASTTTGQLKLANSASAFLGTLQVASLTQATTYTIPASTGASDTFCLQTSANCVSTLQTAYTASTGGTTPEIKLDTTRTGLDIQDADTALTAGTALLSVRASNGAGLGTQLFVVDNAGTTTLRGATTANDAAVLGSDLFTTSSFNAATGWTGISGTGTAATATHTAGGGTTPVTTTFAPSTGSTYEVVFTISGNSTTSNTATVNLGGASSAVLGVNASHTVVITAASTAALQFTPTNNFNGTITGITVKLMTQSTATLKLQDSTGSARLEVRIGGSFNTFLGLNSGQLNTTGSQNTAVGASSMQMNTTGLQNTALGYGSLQFNTSGAANTASGYFSLRNNTTGGSNTANGANSLQSNTSGGSNTANGYNSLQLNTTGNNNTATGYNSLRDNTTGVQNTANGAAALQSNTTGNNNTATGYQALIFNTTGSANTATGYLSLSANTTGTNNTGIGNGAIAVNATGSNNTAIGNSALNFLRTLTGSISATTNNAGNAQFTATNTTGLVVGQTLTITGTTSYNGTRTILSVDSGTTFTVSTAFSTADSAGTWASAVATSNNTATGYQSGQGSGSGYTAQGNSLYGYQTGAVLQSTADYNSLFGYQAGLAVTTGKNNTLLGYTAGNNLTTGSNNIIIGQAVAATAATSSNELNIGNVLFGNVDQTTATNRNIYVKSTNAAAFQVQNASGVSVLNVNTSNNTTTLTALNDTRPLGSELFTGTFATAAGWTNNGSSGQVATATHTNGGGTTAVGMNPSLAAVSAQTYYVTYTITGRTTGSVNMSYGGVSALGFVGNATVKTSIFATSTAALSFVPTNDFDGTISNVTARQATGTALSTLTVNNPDGTAALEVRNGGAGLNNTFIGLQAGQSTTTGASNTAYGALSLSSNTTGTRNTASGYQALSANSTGYDNTAVGHQSLLSNTTGYYNSAIGVGALRSNTTGASNTAAGFNSLYLNTTGSSNTASGSYSLYVNTTGGSNTAFGTNSLLNNTTGSYNTASGNSSLYSNTNGTYNTAVGTSSLYLNSTGNANTASGYYSLINLKTLTGSITATATNGGNAQFTTGSTSGLVVGQTLTIAGTTNYNGTRTVLTVDSATTFTISMAFNTADAAGTWTSAVATNNNTATGYQSGQGTSNGYTAQGNSLYGYQTGLALQSTADNNSMFGNQAGVAVTTGARNTLLGFTAGNNLTTGSNNIIIGQGTTAASATGSNQLNIGGLLQGDLSAGTAKFTGSLTLGTASTTSGSLTLANSASAFTTTIQIAAPAQTTTLTIPASGATDSFCLQTLANCGGTGVTTIGALDGGTANANGATITTTTLFLQSASATYAGLVNTGAQTFAGVKTLTGVATFTAGTTVFGAGDGTTPSASTIRGAAASGSNVQGANLTIDASNGTGAGGSGDLIFRTAAPGANNNVTFDRAQSTNDGAGAATHAFTWTNGITVSSGNTNNVLVVGITIATDGAQTVGTVTYNGASLTKLSSVACASNSCRTELWYIVNPTADGLPHNLVATLSGAGTNVDNWQIGASSYYNVDQTTPLNTPTTNSGTTTGTQTFSNNITTTNNSQVPLDVVGANQLLTAPSQTSRYNNTSVATIASSNAPAVTGTATMSWTSNSANWAWIGTSLNAPVNSTPNTLTNRLQITASGNVGIGTTVNPNQLLSVGGTTGNLTVSSAGNLATSGTLTVTGVQFTNAGSTLYTAAAVGNLAVGGAIGTATATVDVDTTFNITQTTAGQTLTLPNPTSTTAGRIAYVNNIGTASFSMYGLTIAAGSAQQFIWNGTAWTAASVSGTGSGVSTVGALDGGTANATGATISTNTIFLQSASASFAGLVNTGAQTFAGAKTFSGTVNFTSAVDTVSSTVNSLRTDTGSRLQADALGGIILNIDTNNNDTDSVFAVRANGNATDILTVGQTGAVAITGPVTVAAGQSISLVGGITSTRPASPTEGMLYYDTTTKSLLVYANGKWQADRSSSTKIVAATNSLNKDGADYVADGDTATANDGDQVQINQALSAIATTGGSVYLMEGTYTIDAAISIPNNVTLMGSGSGTVVTIPNSLSAQNTTGNIQIITNTDKTTGTGISVQDLRVEGNKTNQAAGDQQGINFDGVGGGSGATARAGVKISNVTARNIYGGSGIVLANSSYGSITGSISQQNGYAGIFLITATFNTVTGSSAQGNGNSGIYLNSASNGNSITGNTSQGNGNAGIYLLGSLNNTISGNSTPSNVYGINLITGSNNNTVNGNTAQGNTTSGLIVDSSNENTVSGNKVHDSGGATLNDGITMSVADANIITNNDVTDTSCTTFCYAINIVNSTSDTNYLADNRLNDSDATKTASINDAGTGTVYAGQSTGVNGTNLVNRNANDIAAFSIQNAAGNNLLTIDSTNSEVELGKASSLTGKLVFYNAANAFTGTLQIAAAAQNTVYTLPAAGATDTVCLLTLANCGGSGSGVTTVGALDGGTANANGATISTNTIFLQSASASFAGVVNTGTQTFAGAKTFSGTLTVGSALTVNSTVTSTGVLTVGSGGNTITLSPSTGYDAAGTARKSKRIQLNAEYAGAVLDKTAGVGGAGDINSGSMTSGVNFTDRMNYYKWTTTQAANQTYDVVIQVPIPTDFSAFASTNPVRISTYSSDLTNGLIKFELRDSTNTVIQNFVTVTPTATNAFQTKDPGTVTGTYTGGDYMTIRVRMQSPNAGDIRIGNIYFDYLSKF